MTPKIFFSIFALSFFLNHTLLGCEADSSERGSNKTPPPPIMVPRQRSHHQLTDLGSPTTSASAFARFIAVAEQKSRDVQANLLIDLLQKHSHDELSPAKGAIIESVLPQLRAIFLKKITWLSPEQYKTVFDLIDKNYPWWSIIHSTKSREMFVEYDGT